VRSQCCVPSKSSSALFQNLCPSQVSGSHDVIKTRGSHFLVQTQARVGFILSVQNYSISFLLAPVLSHNSFCLSRRELRH
jgi:hypothetical protein